MSIMLVIYLIGFVGVLIGEIMAEDREIFQFAELPSGYILALLWPFVLFVVVTLYFEYKLENRRQRKLK